MKLHRPVLVAIPVLLSAFLFAQQPLDNPLLRDLRFRLIGPFRGGRSVAVAGVPSEPKTYYFGATGGGVWKTTDADFPGFRFPTASSRPARWARSRWPIPTPT